LDDLIPELYRKYGKYVNSSRAFPSIQDGLKPVEKRVLLGAYQLAKDKLIKSARIDGHVLGHWHPHSSCYGTIVQLVNQGFLEGQGNFGNNIGVEPSLAAASRYTECRLSKRTYDLAFKLIDYVPWIESELDNEPEHLPVMFPLCLASKEYTTGIGFGYKTLIPCYDLNDLKQRLMFLIGKIKEKPLIKPISNCKILSSDKDLEGLLTTGKATIVFQGLFKLDNAHCKAIIKSWPYGKRFESILGKFEKELVNQDIGYTDESSGENNGTHVVFEVLKQRNREEIFRSFLKKLADVLTGSVSFEINVVDKDTDQVKNMSVDKMLINTFKTYVKTNMVMLEKNESKIQENIKEVQLLEKVKPVLSKYFKNEEVDVDKVIQQISLEVKEDKERIKNLFQKYRITKLLTFKSDYNELIEKLEIIQNNIKNIGDFVVGQYEQL